MRLLIIDNSNGEVESARKLLLQHTSLAEVSVVNSVEEGVEQLSRISADTVLLNVCLEENNNHSVYRQLKACCPDSRIVLLANEEKANQILHSIRHHTPQTDAEEELKRAAQKGIERGDIVSKWINQPIQVGVDIEHSGDMRLADRRHTELLQQTLYRIFESLFSTKSLQELYQAVHLIIGEMIPVSNFYIALYDAASQVIEFPYFVDEFDSPPEPQAYGHGLTEYVLSTGKPLLASPEIYQQLITAGAVDPIGTLPVDWLGVPLKTSTGAVLGAVVVQTYTAGMHYSHLDQYFLSIMAAQVAQVIERKRSEQALLQSEERYRSLVHNLSIGLYRTTPGFPGQFIVANPAFMQMFGIESLHELAKHTVADFYLNPIDRKVFSDYLLENGSAYGYELQLKRLDGSIFWGSVTSRVECDDRTGEVVFYDSSIQDITAKKQHEREQNAVIALATALRQAITRSETLTTVLDQLLALFNAEIAIVASYNFEDDEVYVELARGPQESKVSGLKFPRNQGITPRVIRKAQGELVNHVGEQSEVLMASELGIQSLASVPLLIEGRCIGALTIGCKNELVEAEFRMLQALADLAASTIHRITLYEQTDRRLHRITSLQTITTALNASVDLRMTLSVLVEQVVSQMQADAVDVLLLNQHTKMLEYAAGFGFDHDFFKYSRLKLGEDFAGKAGVERRPVYVADLVKTPSRSHEDWFSAEKFISYYALPLIVNGQVKGVLETYHRHTFHNSDPEWQRFMETLAGQAAIAIDKSELMDRLKRSNEELILAYDATIEGWSNALDMRDKETEGHSRRVAAWTLRLARAMGLSGSELVHIRRGALLHDIGKVALPDNILLKPGPLTDEEWKVVRKHPEHAYQLLSGIAFLAPALDIPFGHHEKWDGSGYPRKLKGQEIPLPARIFAIIDVWDALTSDRPYRSAWPQEKALAYLASEKGKHFDPQVVDTFMDLMENGGWTPVFD